MTWVLQVMDRIIAIDHFSEKDAAAVTADVSAECGCSCCSVKRRSVDPCTTQEHDEPGTYGE